jgi:hypothetical protein
LNKLRTKKHTKLIELLILGTAVLGCTGEFENDALVLEGDWPAHCTQTAFLPRDFGGSRAQTGVNEEFCLTYVYPLDDFILYAQRFGEDQLRFWLENGGGDLVQLHVASNHPGDGDHKTKSFYTFPFGSGAFRRWVNSDAATARGTRYSFPVGSAPFRLQVYPDAATLRGIPSAVILLDNLHWHSNEFIETLVEEGRYHPNPARRYFCDQRSALNPITVVLTADAHNFRVEVPVAVRPNGYDLITIAI